MQEVTRSYRFRLYPNAEQEKSLIHQIRAHRWLYNACLEQYQRYVKPAVMVKRQDENGEWHFAMEHSNWKHSKEWREFVKDWPEYRKKVSMFTQGFEKKAIANVLPDLFGGVSSNSLGVTIKRLESLMNRFRKGEIGMLKFRSQYNFRSVSWYMQGGGASLQTVNIGGRPTPYLYIFGVGLLKVEWHREFPEGSVLKQAVVTYANSGRWYVCFQFKFTPEEPPVHEGPEVGVDVGISEIFLSDGGVIQQARSLENHLKKLRVLSRTLSRRVMKHGYRQCTKCGELYLKKDIDENNFLCTKCGNDKCCRQSKGFERAKIQVAKLHEKITNCRKDFQHKLTRALADKYSFIAVEKLDIAKMIQKSRIVPVRSEDPNGLSTGLKFAEGGWIQGPAEKKKQGTTDLRRGTADSAWGAIRMMLEYKVPDAGGKLVSIDPAYTTRQCSSCGEFSDKKETKRKFVCGHCGSESYRKANAARNVLDLAKDSASALVV